MVICSHIDNFRLEPILRYGKAIFAQGLDIKFNRFLYVIQRLLFCLALRDAARQTRTFHNPETIFAGVNQHLTALVHIFSVSSPPHELLARASAKLDFPPLEGCNRLQTRQYMS